MKQILILLSHLILLEGSGQQIVISSPVNGIIGEKINVTIRDLDPAVTYVLRTEITDEWKRKWYSEISFIPDPKGVFNIEKQAPEKGSYMGIDPIGIFWSAQLEKSPPAIAPGQLPEDSCPVSFTLIKAGQIVQYRKINRFLVRPDVKKEEVHVNGLAGTLYLPGGKKNKTISIILLGGSGGGLTWQRVTAGVLASNGYTVLALAYFNMEGLPQKLEMIPLDYIESAIQFIKDYPGLGKTTVGIMGYSRGAELALIAASYFKEVKFVVAYAPSHVIYQSFSPPDFPQTSSWTYKNIPLPFVPYKGFKPGLSGKENFVNYLKNDSAVMAATIPVDRIRGPVLLFSGKDDLVWPAELMGNKIIDRLMTKNFKYKFQHFSYDSAGHTIARFGYTPATQSMNNGGSAKGNAYAQFDSWEKILAFLKNL